jgi:hypothetical protein
MVRAKFIVQSNEPNNAAEDQNKANTITLLPVITGSEENKQFYKWTPGGQIALSTINPEAAAYFVVGKEYYIDFTDATLVEEAEPVTSQQPVE